jgi:hypothetical protein
MRRNSFNNQLIINPIYILFVIAMIYAIFTPLYYYLTPLIGLAFYYLIEYFDKEYYEIDTYLIFIYVTFVELYNGLFVFSFIIFFLIFHKYIYQYIKEIIVCNWCLPIIYITIGYIGYYLFNLFLLNLFNLDSFSMSYNYLVFIITDIVLSFGFL